MQTTWKEYIVALAKTLWENRPRFKLQSFDDQSYHPKCFMCNEGPEVCPGCQYRTWTLAGETKPPCQKGDY